MEELERQLEVAASFVVKAKDILALQTAIVEELRLAGAPDVAAQATLVSVRRSLQSLQDYHRLLLQERDQWVKLREEMILRQNSGSPAADAATSPPGVPEAAQ